MKWGFYFELAQSACLHFRLPVARFYLCVIVKRLQGPDWTAWRYEVLLVLSNRLFESGAVPELAGVGEGVGGYLRSPGRTHSRFIGFASVT